MLGAFVVVVVAGAMVYASMSIESITNAATKTYTATEVAKHKSAGDCWIIVKSNVYNFSGMTGHHNVSEFCGKNGPSFISASGHNGCTKMGSMKLGALAKATPPATGTGTKTGTSASSSSGSTAGFNFTFGQNNPIISNAGCGTGGKYTNGLLKGMPCNTPITTLPQVEQFVINIMNVIILPLLSVIFTIMVITGGLVYITSAGNTKQIERGKAILTAAIIGLLITVLAYAIVTVFANFIGGGVIG